MAFLLPLMREADGEFPTPGIWAWYEGRWLKREISTRVLFEQQKRRFTKNLKQILR
jgi:hypothetical protein